MPGWLAYRLPGFHFEKKNLLTINFWFQVSLATFGTYIAISEDHYLSPDKAFVTMSYINIFNFLLSIFPLGVFFAGQVERNFNVVWTT